MKNTIKKWSLFVNEELDNYPTVIKPDIKETKFDIVDYNNIPLKEITSPSKGKVIYTENRKLNIMFYSNGRILFNVNNKFFYVGDYKKTLKNIFGKEANFFSIIKKNNPDEINGLNKPAEHIRYYSDGILLKLYKNGSIEITYTEDVDVSREGVIKSLFKGKKSLFFTTSNVNIKTKENTTKVSTKTSSSTTSNEKSEHTKDIIKTSNFYFKKHFIDITLDDFYKKIKNSLKGYKPKDLLKAKMLNNLLEKSISTKEIDNDGIELIKFFQESKGLKKIDGIPGEETFDEYKKLKDIIGKVASEEEKTKTEEEKKPSSEKEDNEISISIVLPGLDKKNGVNKKGKIEVDEFFEETESGFQEATEKDASNIQISNIEDGKIERPDFVKIDGDQKGKLGLDLLDLSPKRFARKWWKSELTSKQLDGYYYKLEIFAREGGFLSRVFKDSKFTFTVNFSKVDKKTFAINSDVICKVIKIEGKNESKTWNWDEYFLIN